MAHRQVNIELGFAAAATEPELTLATYAGVTGCVIRTAQTATSKRLKSYAELMTE